ncbi:MAG: YceI family protein [Betaproteobacteria bacterium]
MKTTMIAITLAVQVSTMTMASAADSYTIDPRHTFPIYEISHLGFSTQRGRFDKSSGKITLDRAAKTGSAEVIIDTTSIDTGVDKLNEHLRSDDFFDTAKYPSMTFKGSKILFNGDVPTSISGELTLMGVTKPVTLTVARFNCAPHPMLKKEVCGADAVATIKRGEFGMTKFAPAIGDEVKLLLNVEAIKD